MKIRWFTNSLSTGEVTAVYKSEWESEFPSAEWVWNGREWQPCQVVSKWNFFGDIDIDEITEERAKELLPARAFS